MASRAFMILLLLLHSLTRCYSQLRSLSASLAGIVELFPTSADLHLLCPLPQELLPPIFSLPAAALLALVLSASSKWSSWTIADKYIFPVTLCLVAHFVSAWWRPTFSTVTFAYLSQYKIVLTGEDDV